MIPAQYYGLVYTIFVVLCIIPILFRYANDVGLYDENRKKEPIIGSLLIAIIIILYIGFRPNSRLFADGPGYWHIIENHLCEDLSGIQLTQDVIFQYMMGFLSSSGVSPRGGFLVLAAITYGFAYLAIRKIFPKDTMFAYLIFCGAFGTFGFATNGIRNGCAMSLFLCALAYKDNIKVALLFLILSFGFHHAMEISITAFVFCSFYKNTKVYMIIWMVALVLAALHVTYFQTFFSQFTDEHGASYLAVTQREITPIFRPDFILYSAAPILLSLWVKKKCQIQSDFYTFVLNVYILMNSVWLLCMYASYTNRIAQLSWSLFPVVLLYPLLNLKLFNNQYRVATWVALGQLAFTSIMLVISFLG